MMVFQCRKIQCMSLFLTVPCHHYFFLPLHLLRQAQFSYFHYFLKPSEFPSWGRSVRFLQLVLRQQQSESIVLKQNNPHVLKNCFSALGSTRSLTLLAAQKVSPPQLDLSFYQGSFLPLQQAKAEGNWQSFMHLNTNNFILIICIHFSLFKEA